LGLALGRAGFSIRHVATRRGDAYNPLFELVRGGAMKTGFHQRIKRLLKVPDRNGPVSGDHDSLPLKTMDRRARLLWHLSRTFDLTLFALYPIEKLFESGRWGPELFVIAERKG
jgi:hypothetical protein